ncbi:hypothetical protein ACW9H6_25445 [Pseudomonas sp. SDO528_S397]
MAGNGTAASFAPSQPRTRSEILMLDPFEEIVGVADSDPEGLIPRGYTEFPLQCRIKKWAPGPSLGRTNTLELIWTIGGVDVVADSREFTEAQFAVEPFPYSLYVPKNFMLEFEAVAQVRYRVREPGSPDVESPARMLKIDRNPPSFFLPSDQLTFVDPNIIASGITEAVLAANEFIEVVCPDYNGQSGNDQIALYLSDETPPFPLIHNYIQTFVFSDEPRVLRVHRDFFRALPNGTAFMTGRLYDRAGNYSALSAATSFQVNLIASPGNLPAPRIRPPAYNDFLLKRDDARAEIFVVINPQYTGFMPGDSVVVIWDGRPVLPAVPITTFPFEVSIPWDILRVPGPLMLEEVPVSYEIHRPGRPAFPSPVSFFWVDFTIAGQDHANAPALLNGTLAPLQVFGKGSGLLNELNLQDRVAGASVWVRLYVDPQPGEVLDLYWNGTGPVAQYTVQPGDVFDQLVRFVPDLSGAFIVSAGNHPQLPVFYTTSNGVNEQHSPLTLVNVHVDPLIQLAPPKIDHTLHGSAQYLTCDSRPATCHGVRWTIAPDDRMALDDEVKFYWQGFRTNNWSDPIAETSFDAAITLTAEHLANGVLMTVLPWDTKIEPLRRFASATGTYYLYRGGALIGESTVGRVRIDRVFAGSGIVCNPGDTGFCDGTDT